MIDAEAQTLWCRPRQTPRAGHRLSRGLATSRDNLHDDIQEVLGPDRMSVSSFVVCFALPDNITSAVDLELQLELDHVDGFSLVVKGMLMACSSAAGSVCSSP